MLEKLRGYFAPRRSVGPTRTAGTTGANVDQGGYVIHDERSGDLNSHELRYITYSNILVNTPIVGAGVRYLLNLVGGAKWTFSPAEADQTSAKRATLAGEMLTSDPLRSWHRVVRYLAMYRMYGFAVMEWTAVRRPDGVITFYDISPRPQSTIERWDLDPQNQVRGMWQRDPVKSEEDYIPRAKTIYLVDDTLDTSPEGLGIFRHLVRPTNRLRAYEDIEKDGFQTDLRGIPIGRAPFAELQEAVAAGTIDAAAKQRIEAPLREFLRSGIRGPKRYTNGGVTIERDETGNLSIALDSAVYRSDDDSQRPSGERRWDIQLLSGDGSSFADIGNAIVRIEGQNARIMGVEQMLLGSDSVGSHALSKDKTEALWLVVESIQKELADAVKRDLLTPLWQLNGWDSPLPEVETETVRYVDVQVVGAVLKDVSIAGLDPESKALGEVYDKLGLTRPDDAEVAAMRRQQERERNTGGGE